jgi:hypothetical protein
MIQGPFTKKKPSLAYLFLALLVFCAALSLFVAYCLLINDLDYRLYGPGRNAAPLVAPKAQVALPAPAKAKSSATAKPQRVISATVTTYQAVAGQADATPCVGAMAGVNFCRPPFPIVANNCLPFGTKVEIRGTRYTVADRMSHRHGCQVFDVLTDGHNYRLTNEPITVL